MALFQVVAPVPTVVTVPTQLAGGRLSLDSATAVKDVASSTTIYYLPYQGRGVALWNSSLQSWRILSIPDAGTSVAIGTLADGTKPYDIFAFDNSGSVAIEVGPVWTSTSARATAITIQDGTLCKAGDKTRRYLGTFMPISTTATQDDNSRRYLFNFYNRVPRKMLAVDSTSSWTYTTATWRAANASTTDGVGRFSFVIGWQDAAVAAYNLSIASNSVGFIAGGIGIGLDSTSAPSDDCRFGGINTINGVVIASYRGFPVVGQHFLSRLEWSTASGTTTWQGTSAVTTFLCSMNGEIFS